MKNEENPKIKTTKIMVTPKMKMIIKINATSKFKTAQKFNITLT